VLGLSGIIPSFNGLSLTFRFVPTCYYPVRHGRIVLCTMRAKS